MAGTLFVVATPIGNLEDISARALRVLREVALIAAEDTRRTRHLLQHFGIATRTTSFHEHSEKGKTAELLARLQQGESLALVSDAGTPAVADPGQHLIQMAHAAGVRVEPIPGPSAAVAAVSASGFPFESYLFLGFPPAKGTGRRRWFERLEKARDVADVAVFYEAPHRIRQTLDEVYRRLGSIDIIIARELTKIHETVRSVRLPAELDAEIGEFTVVANIGRMTDIGPTQQLEPQLLAIEFGDLTDKNGLTRRQAITKLSGKHGIAAREVYTLLEEAKKSVG